MWLQLRPPGREPGGGVTTGAFSLQKGAVVFLWDKSIRLPASRGQGPGLWSPLLQRRCQAWCLDHGRHQRNICRMNHKGEGMYSHPSLVLAELHLGCHTIPSPQRRLTLMGRGRGRGLGAGHGCNSPPLIRLQGTEIRALSSPLHLFTRILPGVNFKSCKRRP